MLRRLLPALVLVPPAVLAFAQPAVADPVPPGANICVTGTLAAGPRPSADPGRTPLVARVQPCAGTTADEVAAARWNLASYYPTEAHIPRGAQLSFSGLGVTEYVARGFRDGDDQVDGSLGAVRAVCVVAGATHSRVACVRTELDPEHRVVITPLPTDSPLVMLPATPGGPSGQEPDPECGACV